MYVYRLEVCVSSDDPLPSSLGNHAKKRIHGVKEVGVGSENKRAPETAVAIQDRWHAHGITQRSEPSSKGQYGRLRRTG